MVSLVGVMDQKGTAGYRFTSVNEYLASHSSLGASVAQSS